MHKLCYSAYPEQERIGVYVKELILVLQARGVNTKGS